MRRPSATLFGRTYFEMKSFRKAAAQCDVPKSTLHGWVSRIGYKVKDGRRGCRKPRKHGHDQRTRLQTIVLQHLLRDPYTAVRTIHGHVHRWASLSTVHRCVRRLGMTRKLASKIRDPNTIEERQRAIQEFLGRTMDLDVNDIVSVDETSFDTRQRPRYGYCHSGKRLPPCSTSRPRSRATMICGTTTQGVQVTRCICGSGNKQEFLAFVDQLLAVCPQRYVLLDNISFHKSKEVLDTLQRAGKTAIFTPPYCPDLNPVEHIFSSIKHVYRQFNHFFHDEEGNVTPEEVDLVMDVWRMVCGTTDWTRTFAHSLGRTQESIADESNRGH